MNFITKRTIVLIFVVIFTLINFRVYFSPAQAEDDIMDIQKDIDKVEDKIEDVQKQLEESQTKYKQKQSEIYMTTNLIKKTEEEIVRKESEIETLSKAIELDKKILKNYVQEMSFGDQTDKVINFLLFEDLLSKFSGNFDQMISVKEKMLNVIAEIKDNKENLGNAKEELSGKKEDHEKLLVVKQMERQEISEDIQDAKTTLEQLTSKLNSLRSRYSEILGKSVSTDDILDAAKFAAKVTGMNKSFLLGVLVQESNKGQSTGSCDYKQSKMSSTQLTAFKKICASLDYDYKKKKVSCPPKNYKGTGGAMGVPQFMPTTWLGYEDTIASLSGHNPPDPWNLVDGVVAMASKLSNDGADKKTRFAEAKSYCIYLAGRNWGYYCFGTDKYKKSYEDVNCWGSSIRNYGEKVLCLKDNYEKYY